MMVLAIAYIKSSNKVYLMRASLLLKSEEQRDLSGNDFLKGMDIFKTSTELEDEIGILESYHMVANAINELDFGIGYYTKRYTKSEEKYGDFPFIIKMDSTVNQLTGIPIYITEKSNNTYQLRAEGEEIDAYNFLTRQVEDHLTKVEINHTGTFGDPTKMANLGITIWANPKFPVKDDEEYFFIIYNLKSVVAYYKSNLEVKPISRESNIVELSMRGEVPQKTINFLNKLLDVYLENELYKKNQLGIKTIQFIDNQLSGVSDTLNQVEGSLESFRTKSKIQDISATAENLSKNLDKLETEKANLEVKLKYYSNIANSMNEGRFGDIVAPSTFGLEDPLLSSLLIELSKLNQERAGLNYNAKESNPLTEVVELKIKNTKETLRENVNNIINITTIALNDLNSRIYKIKWQLSKLPGNERELVNIKRKFDFSDNVYNYLLEKRAEAGIAIASNQVDKAIVDRAMVVGDGPVAPNSKFIYLIAIALALVFPIAFIVFKDFWQDHLVTHKDIENATEIPYIGSIIHGNRKMKQKLQLNGEKYTLLNESFQTLRVNLQYLTLGKNKSVIGFTSSIQSEGKTFCAVNLAIAMASAGKKTLIIDADMRRSTLSNYFDLTNDWGLSTYLIEQSTLADTIQKTDIKNIDIIPAGPIPPNPLTLIGKSRMSELMHTLKDIYDIIIIDSPPIGFVSEYLILMKYTDANLYVVRSDHTSRHHLTTINKLYQDKKIDNISILLNDVKTGLNGYSYAYRKAYQY